jgi:orotidine-5'-phosphate decarboxylase
MSIVEKYNQRVEQVNSLVCVGLDSAFDRLPEHFIHHEFPLFTFNRWIIEQTHPFVSAYKPNMAFYEARGDRGFSSLRMTLEYLRLNHPNILTICDAKRADIGSTSQAYASAIFDWFGFDAVTLNPYLGRDALEPFLARRDRGCIILCRTSNPGASELQDLPINGKPLWQIVLEKVRDEWNQNQNCLLVMGATHPDELRQAREMAGDMTLLVPGIGAQGADLAQTLRAGLTADGRGLILNSSRDIIFANDPGAAARDLRDRINQHR